MAGTHASSFLERHFRIKVSSIPMDMCVIGGATPSIRSLSTFSVWPDFKYRGQQSAIGGVAIHDTVSKK